ARCVDAAASALERTDLAAANCQVVEHDCPRLDVEYAPDGDVVLDERWPLRQRRCAEGGIALAHDGQALGDHRAAAGALHLQGIARIGGVLSDLKRSRDAAAAGQVHDQACGWSRTR